MEGKLYRSTTDKRIAGVCGGLGEYFSVDPTVLRIAWVGIALITLPFGPGGLFIGGLAYLACWLIIPPKPNTHPL
jgi:phage shock protein C